MESRQVDSTASVQTEALGTTVLFLTVPSCHWYQEKAGRDGMGCVQDQEEDGSTPVGVV